MWTGRAGRGGSEQLPQRGSLAYKVSDLVLIGELFASSNVFALILLKIIFMKLCIFVTKLSWFAQDSPNFSSESPASLHPPQSQADLNGSSPYLYASSTLIKIEV